VIVTADRAPSFVQAAVGSSAAPGYGRGQAGSDRSL
jgi:hypothetical protein